MQWPYLQELVSTSVLEEVDYFLAQTLAPEVTEEQAAVLAALMACSRQGHLCLDVEQKLEGFPERFQEMFARGVQTLPSELVEDVTSDSTFPKKPICRFVKLLYFQKHWVFETRFIHHIQRLVQSSLVDSIQAKELAGLNEEQALAVQTSLSHPLSLIAGGPGTGKTYTAAHLVKAYLEGTSDKRIFVAAPTGKAAARLESSLMQMGLARESFQCGTLHALLGLRSSSDLNKEGKLLAVDLLLVDECSMIDARLFPYLLSSVQEGTRVVLMGDPDQLPPVESGSFFADLVQASLGIPCTSLKKCMRSERQEILQLAEKVKRGDEITSHLALDEETIWQHVKEDFKRIFLQDKPEKILEEMDDLRLLSCIRKGPFGVDAVNQRMFAQCRREGQVWAAPILITRTDARLKLYNGDTGILLMRGQVAERAIFLNGVELPVSALPPFEYAYCLSVHKSQGSEYKRVVLLVPQGSESFGREVLYTAVTRAREKLEIAADEGALRDALARTSRRRSGFARRS